MTDEQFWNIADEYEEINKDNQSYIPRKNWKTLAIDIAETNNMDYNETLSDLTLFRYGKMLSDNIPVVCLKVIKKLCRKKEN